MPAELVKVFPIATSAGVASPRRVVAFDYGIEPSVYCAWSIKYLFVGVPINLKLVYSLLIAVISAPP